MSALHITSTTMEAAAERAVGKIYRREGRMTEELCFKSKLPYRMHSMMCAPSWRSVVRSRKRVAAALAQSDSLRKRWSRSEGAPLEDRKKPPRKLFCALLIGASLAWAAIREAPLARPMRP
jgi:hypothetical protein